jgi:hypothetical protein
LAPGKLRMTLPLLCQLSSRAAVFSALPGCFSVCAHFLSRCVLQIHLFRW